MREGERDGGRERKRKEGREVERGREIKRERNQESFREGEHRQNRVRLLRLFKMRTKHEQCEMRGGRERERERQGESERERETREAITEMGEERLIYKEKAVEMEALGAEG